MISKKNFNNGGRRRRVLVNVVSLVAVFMMMAAASISYSGRLFGHDLKNDTPEAAPDKTEAVGSQITAADGNAVIKTDGLVDVSGYAGPVPVEITITDGRVSKVTPLDNSETPRFFKKVTDAGLLDAWNGLTPQDALNKKVDAVTGATYSSHALIANVHAGLEYYQGQAITVAETEKPGLELYTALIVALMAMIIPLFVKNKRYRIVQQLLNAGVLGFWCGTFVDYTMMLGWLGGGAVSWASAVPLLMLVAAFIYPLFGRDGYYCAWVCPLGSLQELASRCNPHHRLHLSPGAVKWLTRFRMLLWGALMLLLWTGLWVRWIDYELFTAFFLKQAAWGILVAGGAVILLSVWIPRPYCRFVCPTGTLLRMSQDIDTH